MGGFRGRQVQSADSDSGGKKGCREWRQKTSAVACCEESTALDTVAPAEFQLGSAATAEGGDVGERRPASAHCEADLRVLCYLLYVTSDIVFQLFFHVQHPRLCDVCFASVQIGAGDE